MGLEYRSQVIHRGTNETLTKAKKKLETDPAQFVEQDIKEFVRTSPDNRLSFLNDYVIWMSRW